MAFWFALVDYQVGKAMRFLAENIEMKVCDIALPRLSVHGDVQLHDG